LRWLRRHFIPAIISFAWNILRFAFARSRRLGPVTGCYSDLELLQRGGPGVEGRIILLDQGAPVVTPESPMVLAKRGQHSQQPFPVFWTRHRNIRLIGPSLAHINAQKQVSVEAVYGRPFLKHDPAYQYFLRGEPLRLAGAWTSVLSRWVPTDNAQPYAHWLIDALPRLAVLKEFPAETRILAPAQKAGYMVESLEMLGLSNRCRWTEETHIEVEDYYFASAPSIIACYSPYTVQVVRGMFLPLRDSRKTTPKRFFVRRSGTVRNITNEAEVLEFFEKAGWAIVDLVNVPFAEQIAWFAGAEAIAGIHGSGMSNTLWSPRGCKVIELFCDQYIGGDAEWTAQCTGAEYRSLIFPSDPRLNAIVDLNRVRAALKSAELL
jgi:capsular polysaccharide biosynthesis protein